MTIEHGPPRPAQGRLAGQTGMAASSMSELLRNTAARMPDHPAILAPGRETLTIRGLLTLAERTVAAVNTLGVLSGDRVVVALPSSVETAAVYLSMTAGVGVLPLSPDLTSENYAACIKQIGASAVVVQRDYPSAAREAAERAGIRLIEVAPVAGAPAGTFEIVGVAASSSAPQFAAPDDFAILLHTSGTTGAPKIVPWTQREATTQVVLYVTSITRAPGVSVVVQPLYHIGGVSQVAIGAATGAGFTCLSEFTASEVYRALARYRPTILTAVPAMLEALVREAYRHGDELRQFQLESIYVGSTALPEALHRETQRVFGAGVRTAYGMTEIPLIAGTSHYDESVHRPGSVGKPWPVTQVQIADDEGMTLPTGETGEIAVRSPLMFRGYLDNPEANAEAFRDGWFRTGDTGYFDADGFLYVVGRGKEVINRGGSKIAPLDVEAVIERHPAVREAAAFGFPHAALGEDLAVAVVLEDAAITERELRRFAADHLPLNRVPSRFVVVDELPRTALGKLQRNALGERFAATLRR